MPIDNWEGPLRILIVGLAAYFGLVLIVRLSGKRTLAKLSAFDFLVTVALGSSLATIILSSSTPLVEGLTGIVLLVGLQAAISWAGAHSRTVRAWIKSEPALLLREGEFLEGPMRSERVGRDDVLSAIRKAGAADVSEVLAVVLEPDGSLSVLRGTDMPAPATSALRDVGGAHTDHTPRLSMS